MDKPVEAGQSAVVKIELKAGTATAGQDYSNTINYTLGSNSGSINSGDTITISEGLSKITVKISASTDTKFLEPNEDLSLVVTPVSGVQNTLTLQSQITVVDATPIPTVSITSATDPTPVEGTKAVSIFAFSGATAVDNTAKLVLEDGYPAINGLSAASSALLNADYSNTLEYSTNGGATYTAATSGDTITIPAGSSNLYVRTNTLVTNTVRDNIQYKLSLIPISSGITDPGHAGWSGVQINDKGAINTANGQWGNLIAWPLLPLHAALLPDGKIMSYGTAGTKAGAAISTDGTSTSNYNGTNAGISPSINKQASLPNGVTTVIQTGSFIYDVWDYSSAFHNTLPNTTKTDLFCSAQIILPVADQLFLAGGDNYDPTLFPNPGRLDTNFGTKDTNIMDWKAANPILSESGAMNAARWYATLTTLMDGSIYIQGGKGANNGSGLPETAGRDHPERRGKNAGDGNTLLTGIDTSALNLWYPRNFLDSSGNIFGMDTEGQMYFINPNPNNGAGTIKRVGTLPTLGNGAQVSLYNAWNQTLFPGGEAANSNYGSTAVMYAPDKILRIGAPEEHRNDGKTYINSNAAFVISLNTNTNINNSSVSFRQTNSMTGTNGAGSPNSRVWTTATLLADGQVMVSGGSSDYNLKCRLDSSLTNTGYPEVNHNSMGKACQGGSTNIANYKPEMWNPTTEQWRVVGADAQQTRLYHNIALLLPDATLLTGAGGSPGPEANTNVQIFKPPYLFKSDGSLATRPSITNAPTQLTAGQTATFNVTYNHTSPITRVTLVKTGSVTHDFNMEQRIVEPTITARNGNQLTLQLPNNRNLMSPGYYMLFVLDKDGVPSQAQILKMTP